MRAVFIPVEWTQSTPVTPVPLNRAVKVQGELREAAYIQVPLNGATKHEVKI